MSFDVRDIRAGMDVYTLDNVYLGTVVRLDPGHSTAVTSESVDPAARQSSIQNGELFGPMPTQTLGNPGPRTQAAANQYATPADGAEPIGEDGSLVVARWGLVGRRRVPVSSIQAVSLERVVLNRDASEL